LGKSPFKISAAKGDDYRSQAKSDLEPGIFPQCGFLAAALDSAVDQGNKGLNQSGKRAKGFNKIPRKVRGGKKIVGDKILN